MAKINKRIIDNVKRYVTKLREDGITIESAYLFGSCAKGVEHTWSDIDVAIVSSDITDDRVDERIRFTKIAHEIDSRIEPVPYHPRFFVEEDPLVWEIKKTGKEIIIRGS